MSIQTAPETTRARDKALRRLISLTAEMRKETDNLGHFIDPGQGKAVSDLRHQINVTRSRVATIAGHEWLQAIDPTDEPEPAGDHDRTGMAPASAQPNALGAGA